jgi:hypothetical protein
MQRLGILLLALAALAYADDRWIQFHSGPFEVFSDAGQRPARATLVRFEEFRHALGQVVGDNDLQTAMPVRILVFKKGEPHPEGDRVLTGRDRYAIALTAEEMPPPELMRRLTRLFLDSNTARMPAQFEKGIEDLFSTIEVNGIKITLGKPPAPVNRDWARVQLLATSQEYYGKLRVILYNLRRGVPPDAAYKNAVNKTPAEIEQETDRYLAGGKFATTEISPRPMSERDFEERPVEPDAARLAVADLLTPQSRAAYQDMVKAGINVPQSHEGLGLLALQAQQKDEARREFSAAMQAGSKNGRIYMEYARLEPDNAKVLAALEQASKLNPKLAEPHFLAAQRAADAERRITELKTAATLDPRRLDYWQSLAEAYLKQGNFGEAAKAWTSAEQAAATGADRERMRKARASIEQQRLDYEEAERKRAAEENARDIARLKEQARAELRAAEARMNQGKPPAQTADKPVPWWDGPKPSGKVRGALKQVDCLGRQLRLVVEAEGGKRTRLLVPDASQIAIQGGGEQALACGPQKGRQVSVQFFPKANAKLSTSGEVAVIEFQ